MVRDVYFITVIIIIIIIIRQKTLQTLSISMGIGLSFCSFVDLHFFCWSDYINTLTVECVGCSLLINRDSTCIYGPQQFHLNYIYVYVCIYIYIYIYIYI